MKIYTGPVSCNGVFSTFAGVMLWAGAKKWETTEVGAAQCFSEERGRVSSASNSAARYLMSQVHREMRCCDGQMWLAGSHHHSLLCEVCACFPKIRRVMETLPFSRKVLNIAPLSLHPKCKNYLAWYSSSPGLCSLIYQECFIFVDHKTCPGMSSSICSPQMWLLQSSPVGAQISFDLWKLWFGRKRSSTPGSVLLPAQGCCKINSIVRKGEASNLPAP